MFWYLNMISNVKWGSELSRSFSVPLGIKQGGINSPDFFGCYFDNLLTILRGMKIGCHMYGILLSIILFADDICLLAPTRSALAKLFSTCTDYCTKYGLTFNSKKSKIMVFSKKRINLDSIKPITIDGNVLDFDDSITCLGTKIVSDDGFRFSSADDLSSFYRSANSIIGAMNKPSDAILLHLVYTNCVPILTYGCAVKEYPSREMTDCNTALNNVIRRIFSYSRWESIRTLRISYGYKSLTELFASAKNKFHDQLPNHCNSILNSLFQNELA